MKWQGKHNQVLGGWAFLNARFRLDEPFRNNFCFKRMYLKILLTDDYRSPWNGTITIFFGLF